MPRPIRIERADLPISVTVRCREGRRLLMPLASIGALMLWRLAQAMSRYGVRLFVTVQMGNHIHLLCSAPRGNLSSFMGSFLGYLAGDINKLLGRRGDGVFRRHSQVHVLDNEAALERASYILGNPALSHLVDTIDDWPGLSSAPALLHGKRMVARHFDERGWIRVGRPADRSPFEHQLELVHERLPGCEHLDDVAYAAAIRELVNLREEMARSERTHGPRDLDSLLNAAPDTIPAKMKSQPCPPCHATCPVRRAEYLETCRAMRDSYLRASSRWRSGDLTVSFPTGTYRPKIDWTGDAPTFGVAT